MSTRGRPCPTCGNPVAHGETACFSCGHRMAMTCRECGSTDIRIVKRFTRWGWQAAIVGVLLIPIGVGLILLLLSTGLVWRELRCRACGTAYSLD